MVTINYLVENSLKKVKERLESSPSEIAYKDRNGWTPLHRAVGKGISPYRQEKMVNLLLEKGADRNARTLKGETPYDIALRYKCPKRICGLVKATMVSEIIRMEEDDTPNVEMLENLVETISTLEDMKIFYTLVSAHSKILEISVEKKRDLLRKVFLRFSVTFPFGGTNTLELAKFREILCKAKADNIIQMKEQFVFEQHANRNDIYNSNHFFSLREQVDMNTYNIKKIANTFVNYQENDKREKRFKKNLKIGGGVLKLLSFGFGTGAVDILEGVVETFMENVVDLSDIKEIENVIVSNYEKLGLSKEDRDQILQIVVDDIITFEYEENAKAYVTEFVKVSKRFSKNHQRDPSDKMEELEYRFINMENNFEEFKRSMKLKKINIENDFEEFKRSMKQKKRKWWF